MCKTAYRNRTLNSEQGFTLVDVAVVTVLLALLGAVIYSTLDGMMRTREALEGQRLVTHTAQYVLSRMTRELANRTEDSIVPPSESPTPVPADGSGELGEEEQDDENEESDLLMLGVDKKNGDHDADQIIFSSVGSGQVLFNAAQNFGVVQISYRLEQRRGSGLGTEATLGSDAEHSVLVREERPAQVVDKKKAEERTLIFPISDHVTSLNFRYRRKNRWLNEWKEDQIGLPQAVEITLRVEDETGKGETFRTAVSLTRPGEEEE